MKAASLATDGDRVSLDPGGATGQAAAALLGWYDAGCRTPPWRVTPAARRLGARPDPYRVWLSEIMLQQTTVAAATPYFERFVARWPDVGALAAAALDQVLAAWAGLGYYARARNLHRCAQMVAGEHGGRFPADEAALRALPGIGVYTAAAIAAIAFDRRAVVVDGNVERVMARRHAVTAPLPGARPELRRLAAALTPAARPGDYAQAVMDLGATICTPRNPDCGRCPWRGDCAGRALGLAAELPGRAPRPAKPVRRGVAYLALRADDGVLLNRRPESGLLGGMLELPGTGWTEAGPAAEEIAAAAPLEAGWIETGVEARHSFTHFHLILSLRAARVPAGSRARRGEWRPRAALSGLAIPTAVRKALTPGLRYLDRLG